MRWPTLGGMVLVLCFAGPVLAEPTKARITVDEVEVRSGPSVMAYPTSKLKRGDEVEIKGDAEGDFLPIVPPRNTSFSWINNLSLDRSSATDKTPVVKEEGAPVLVGSGVPPNRQPDKIGAHLKSGIPVVIIGSSMKAPDGSIWWPIQATPGEARYIPKSAVQQPTATVASASPAGRIPGQDSAGGAAAKPGDIGPQLWNQAVQAQQAGNTAEAIRLYDLCRNKTSNTEMQARCNQQIQCLQNYYRAPTTCQGPACTNYPPSSTVSLAYANQGTGQPVVRWSDKGRLRRSGVPIDGKPAYVLEDLTGKPIVYATGSQPGVNLDAYIFQNVNLYGSVYYHPVLRQYCMVVTQVSRVQ